MSPFRRIAKPVCLTVTAALLALTLHIPAANAALVSTEAVLHSAQAQHNISRVHDALNRDDVKTQLVALGVDSNLVQARVDALSDDEAQQLAQRLDQMPAGAGIVEILLFVFILLLITDLLGLTNVFPFTKKGALHR